MGLGNSPRPLRQFIVHGNRDFPGAMIPNFSRTTHQGHHQTRRQPPILKKVRSVAPSAGLSQLWTTDTFSSNLSAARELASHE